MLNFSWNFTITEHLFLQSPNLSLMRALLDALFKCLEWRSIIQSRSSRMGVRGSRGTMNPPKFYKNRKYTILAHLPVFDRLLRLCYMRQRTLLCKKKAFRSAFKTASVEFSRICIRDTTNFEQFSHRFHKNSAYQSLSGFLVSFKIT